MLAGDLTVMVGQSYITKIGRPARIDKLDASSKDAPFKGRVQLYASFATCWWNEEGYCFNARGEGEFEDEVYSVADFDLEQPVN